MSIIKYSKIWFILSTVLIVLSFFVMGYNGLPLGIDFTGGSLMEIHFLKATEPGQIIPTYDEVKEILGTIEEDIGTPTIIPTENGGYIIRTKEIENDTHLKIKTSFSDRYENFEETRFQSIGPSVGKTLQNNAIKAVLIAIFGIILFIAYSFRKIPRRLSPWTFSFTAIIALVHDIIVTVGVFAILSNIMGYEIDSLFITALLTILGYSVNDTIVVFDRIRENLKYQRRDQSFADIANDSLNQTISRSINTSVTTLITLFALFLFGGETIKMFVLTLIIGFISGTYSSIFIASPLLVLWKKSSK